MTDKNSIFEPKSEGVYCRKSMKFLTEYYNNEDCNGIVIPDWCIFKTKEK